MNILRAIGAFFARIGRWIKETAWIQPLLIVGGIFAIIFSIPAITGAVQNSASDETSFYNNYKVSLEGVASDKSDAQKVIEDIFLLTDNLTTVKENAAKDSKYGAKFFITFVQKNCANCKEMQSAFDILQKNWDNNYKQTDGKSYPFKMVTIFADQITDDYKDCLEDKPFMEFLHKENVQDLFDIAWEVAESRPYFAEQKFDTGDYYKALEAMASGQVGDDGFRTPTTILIDYTDPSKFPEGISEVFFTVDGAYDGDTGSRSKAQTIMDAWNHKGKFEE